MTAQTLKFTALSENERKAPLQVGKLTHGDRVELTVSLPPKAAHLVEALLGYLARGEGVAVLTEDRELSPNDAASLLGISRPLVVHRMDIGDLPFRYVGKHRRAKLADVLALKSRIDAQRAAMEALADDALDLSQRYDV